MIDHSSTGEIRHQQTWTSRAIRWLAACLVLLQALAPPGAMADRRQTASGDFVMVICTAHGLMRAVLDDKGEIIDTIPVDGPVSPGHDCPCGVACHMAVLAPPAIPVVFVQTAAFVVVTWGGAFAAPTPRAPDHGPPLGARAPPSPLV